MTNDFKTLADLSIGDLFCLAKDGTWFEIIDIDDITQKRHCRSLNKFEFFNPPGKDYIYTHIPKTTPVYSYSKANYYPSKINQKNHE